MIIRSFLIAVLFLVMLPFAHAADVHAERGVYPKTVKRWKKALEHASFGSTSWIYKQHSRDRLHISGKRDVILMVPQTANPKNITLVVWFHGLGGFKDKTFRQRLMPQMDYIVEGGNSVALAIPEMPWSANTQTPRGRQGKVWQKPGDLYKFVSEVKLRLQRWAFDVHNTKLSEVKLVFVGHSAGGSAIKSASIRGDLCRLNPEAVIFSDASYGHWLDKAWSMCLKHRVDIDLHVLVRIGDKPYYNVRRLLKNRPDDFIKPHIYYHALPRKFWSHTEIGNRALIVTDIFPPDC